MPAPWMTPGIFGPLAGAAGSLGGLFGGQQIPQGGVMGEPQINPQADQRMAIAAQLLAGSGWSPQKRGFGEILGNALMAGQQARMSAQQMVSQQQREKADQEFRQAQLEAAKRQQQTTPFGSIDPDQFTPESLAKFQQTNDYGSLVPRNAQSNTADIQNWQFYQGLSPEQQKQWMALQRQPTAPQLAMVNGVPTLVDRFQGTINPLTTQQAEIEAATAKAEAEAGGRAVGTARGEAQGGIEKKGVAAMSTLDTLDLANNLIDVATGSAAGAARDKVVGWLGYAPKGAQATAELKILQANLMTNMPRMEGPQSDRDVQLYREAAGQIGDPSVPRETKKAAIRMIRQLNNKYIERASSGEGVRRYNPATGRIE